VRKTRSAKSSPDVVLIGIDKEDTACYAVQPNSYLDLEAMLMAPVDVVTGVVLFKII